MYGAIIGDLAGSIYEYDQYFNVSNVIMEKLIPDGAFYSDDTILTIAVLDAILNDKNYDYYLRKYIRDYSDYRPDCDRYFDKPFSPGTMMWSKDNKIGTSHGNGAMMRISAVGYMFDDEKDIINNAIAATCPSHNSSEAIDAATKVALIIYYLRCGFSKEEILKKLDIKLSYVPFKKFNMTCEDTFNNCMYAFFTSNSFKNAIKKTLFMGGDTDTNCAIVGSMSEALYGIDKHLIDNVNSRLPKKFVKTLNDSGYLK